MTPHVYLLSGVATSADFMTPLSVELGERYERAGSKAHFHFLHPYGTWDRRLIKQLVEVKQDVSNKSIHRMASIRGKLLGETMMKAGRENAIVLIGHSAGGIAAVHAASILIHNGFHVSCIVQIGCPKHTIPARLQARTLYTYGVNPSTYRISDPIVRIGIWGGWEKGRFGWPIWNPKLYAPMHISSIPIIGGHADYFRSSQPFLNKEGVSNLEISTNEMWNFINCIK